MKSKRKTKDVMENVVQQMNTVVQIAFALMLTEVSYFDYFLFLILTHGRNENFS